MEEKKIIEKYLLNLLARKDYSIKQLQHKCELKKFNSIYFNEVINEFISKNYISEARYINSFIKSEFRKGRSPKFISQSLLEQNIQLSPSEILNYLDDDVNVYQEIQAILERKFKQVDTAKLKIDYHYKAKTYQKLMRMAASKGFTFSEAQIMIRELLD
jgi:SOS response regulatory protein OraA/RecX